MPENENNPSPKKKKRGFLWVIIVILIVVLAATMGGYALSYYDALPAWVSDMLPDNGRSQTEQVYTSPEVSPLPAEDEAEPSPTAAPATEDEEEPAKTDEGKDETAAVSGSAAESGADGAVASPAVTAVPYIGADAAADAALEHSKVAEKNADFSSVLLKEQNGMMLYQVIFTAGDYRYEYYIDSTTGRVESWQKTDMTVPAEDTVAASAMDEPAAQAQTGADAGENSTAADSKQTGATILLGEEEAKKLAMAHANISEKDLSDIQCKMELRGLNLIYEVEMKTQLMEYEYEVDAVTGDIVGFDVEPIKGTK